MVHFLSSRKLHRAVASLVIAFFIVITYTPPANAAPITDFKPGHIIDDEIFYNKNSMSLNDIQNFLDNLMPNCDTWGTQKSGYGNLTNAQYAQQIQGWPGPPYVCINKYYENPDTHETSYEKGGGAFTGGISAAQIFYDAAQTYNINPQVLLVMLKKESAGPLTADNWPLKSQYNYAMGYACPDSGPNNSANCSSNYAGLYNQVTLSAWQLNYYKEHPNNYRYHIGLNDIQYSPDVSCGTKQVNIDNIATLSLYIYTPYTPNDASLAAYPGTASCGAYGNRNFFAYFKEWFGITSLDLVRGPDGDAYKIEDGKKRVFADSETFSSYSYKWSDLIPLTSYQLSQIPNGPAMPYNVNFRNNKFVRVTDSVYLVENGVKRPVSDGITLLSYSYTFANTVLISPLEMSKIPDGAQVPYNVNFRNGQLIRSSDNDGVYFVERGTKRPFPDGETFSSYSYTWTGIIQIGPLEMSKIPDGAQMPMKSI